MTGASSGLGRAIAKSYAQNGANVILIARDLARLEQVADEIEAIYDDLGLKDKTTTIVSADLGELSQVTKLCASLKEQFKVIDILVCAHALIYQLSPLHHISVKDWDKIFNVNVHGNFVLLKYLHPLLSASDNGRIIIVTDKVVQNADPFFGAYSASKAALVNMAQTYAKEQNDLTNIKVSIVEPQDELDTTMRAKLSPGGKSDNIVNPEKIIDIFVKLAGCDMDKNGKVWQIAA